MSSIKKLTDAQRRQLLSAAPVSGADALRIIDQLTAALEARGPVCPNCKGKKVFPTGWECSQCKGSGLEADRSEALQARVAELEADRTDLTLALGVASVRCANAERLAERHELACVESTASANAAESELADLRGRVARAETYLQASSRAEPEVRAALEALRGR